MDVLWPGFLLLLGLLPILLGIYIWILRRRRRYAVRYSSLSLVRAALTKQSRWRRHLPFALFLAALGSLSIALARPVAIVNDAFAKKHFPADPPDAPQSTLSLKPSHDCAATREHARAHRDSRPSAA